MWGPRCDSHSQLLLRELQRDLLLAVELHPAAQPRAVFQGAQFREVGFQGAQFREFRRSRQLRQCRAPRRCGPPPVPPPIVLPRRVSGFVQVEVEGGTRGEVPDAKVLAFSGMGHLTLALDARVWLATGQSLATGRQA